MASDHHSRSAKRRTPRSNGSERQQRYRAAHKLRSIDISQTTAALLAELRTRTGLGNDGVIAAAAELLAGKPKLVRRLAKAHAAPAGTAQGTKAQPRAEPLPSPSAEDTTAPPAVGRAALAPAAAPAAPTAAGQGPPHRRSATGPRRRRKAAQPTPDPKQSKLDLG